MRIIKIGENKHNSWIQSYYYKIFTLILLFSFISSCKVYSPKTIPIHQYSRKNDLFISGNLSMPVAVSGSVAYSPFSHSSIQLYATAAPEESYYLQGSTGVYWKNLSATCFEVLVGYGNGRGKAIESPNPAFLIGNYDLYFAQLNIGQSIQKRKKTEYGLGLKSGIFNVNISDYGFYESDGLDPVCYHNRYWLIEPIAYIRNSGGRISTGLYICGTSLINILPNQQLIPFNGISGGISFEYKIR